MECVPGGGGACPPCGRGSLASTRGVGNLAPRRYHRPMGAGDRARALAWAVVGLSTALACEPQPRREAAAPPPTASATTAPPSAADTGFFSGAPAYESSRVQTSAAAAHKAKKVSVSMPSVPACLRCHKAGGGAVPFLFAGTVFADHAATRGAADVEVRVVDGSGTATSVHSDANGNFWVKGTGSLGKAHAGGRSASSVR